MYVHTISISTASSLIQEDSSALYSSVFVVAIHWLLQSGFRFPPIIVDAPQQKRLRNSVLMWSRLNMRFPSIYFGPATAPPFFIVYRSMVLLVSISTCLIIIPNLWQMLLPDSEQSFCFLHFPLLFGLVIHTWEVVNHFCFINHHIPFS